MRKTSRKAKTPPGDFKVTISKNPLINNQVITSIRNLTTTLTYPKIPTYSWTFASIPSWTSSYCSLLSLDAQITNLWLTLCTDPSTWLTPAILSDIVGYKVLHFINNEDQEALGYKTLRHTNAIASQKENKSLGLCIRIWQFLK